MGVELWVAVALACDAPVAPAELDAPLAEAEAAFAALDIEGFLARSDAVRAAVPCLSAVPAPSQVGRLHRVEGLRRFGDRDLDAVRWFAAARAADPAATLAPDLAPPGSPLAADFVAMDPTAGGHTTLDAPLEGALWIDGVAGRERPAERPALVQWVGVDGAVRFTAWGPADLALPPYPAVPPPPPPVPDVVTVAPLPAPLAPPLPPRSLRVPLLAATAGAAVATGGIYGWGAVSRARWADPDTPDGELPGLVARTNALAVGSVIGAAATLGLSTAVVLTW